MIILRNRFFSDEEEKDNKYHTGRNTAIAGGLGTLGTVAVSSKYSPDFLLDKKSKLNLLNKADELRHERKKLLEDIKLRKETEDSVKDRIKDSERFMNEATEIFRKFIKEGLVVEDSDSPANTDPIGDLKKKIEGSTTIDSEKKKSLLKDIKDVETKIKQAALCRVGLDKDNADCVNWARNQKDKMKNLDIDLAHWSASKNEVKQNLAKLKKTLAWGAGITGAATLGTYLYNRHKNKQLEDK